MGKIEKTVHSVVESVCNSFEYPTHNDRRDITNIAARKLNDKYNINCASDGSKAGDYLVEALDLYIY